MGGSEGRLQGQTEGEFRCDFRLAALRTFKITGSRSAYLTRQTEFCSSLGGTEPLGESVPARAKSRQTESFVALLQIIS